jgi:hypothetical protein
VLDDRSRALRISKSGGGVWRAGEGTGSRLTGAQKNLEPTYIRLLRGIMVGLRSIECEFDHLFLVEACLTNGHGFRGSQKAAEALARRRGRWQSMARRAEKFRADSRQAATRKWGLRSIECEFDHLFLVEACLTNGHAFGGSQKAAETFGAQARAWAIVWYARRRI